MRTFLPVYFLLALIFYLCPLYGEEVIKVGVNSGWGSKSIVDILNSGSEFKASEMQIITEELLGGIDVLVITQLADAGIISRSALKLRDWVEEGNGILLLHGAVGYGSHIPVFMKVGKGGVFLECEPLKPVRRHPVTEGLKKGRLFLPKTGYNYISLHSGVSGEALMESDSGSIAVVAGKQGSGRVVLNSIGAGAVGDHFDDELGIPYEELADFRKPEDQELLLILNSIRWLGFSSE